MILSTVVGIAFDFADVNPIKALFWTAILNGLLAPFLLIAILKVASDSEIMAGQPSSRLSRWVVWSRPLMIAAAAGMFLLAERSPVGAGLQTPTPNCRLHTLLRATSFRPSPEKP